MTTTLSPIPATPTRRARRSANLESLAMEKRAAEFSGLPEGVAHPAQLLATLKAAAAALKIPKPVVELIDHLHRRTQPRDWQTGSRPLCWPSNQELMHAMGRQPTALSDAIRAASKLGLLVMKDSPSGKRYGSRDQDGRIIEERSFGFDLSPLALRYGELKAAADHHSALHRARMEARRDVTRQREGLLQIIDTADELGLWSSFWDDVAKKAEDTRAMLTPTLPLAETQHIAQCLAKWREEARGVLDHAALDARCQQTAQEAGDSRAEEVGTEAESESLLSEKRELKNTTNPSLFIEQEIVQAQQEGCSGEGAALPRRIAQEARKTASSDPGLRPEQVLELEARGITAPRVAALCPVLAAYVGPDPSWRELADAARAVAAHYDLSHRTWARAAVQLGLPLAVTVFAIMATLPHEHFTKGPGAWFGAMTAKHAAGQLKLAEIIGGFHGMRTRHEAGRCPGNPPSRRGETHARSSIGNLAAGVLNRLPMVGRA